ncbi:MAG: MFS transporter, partial [Nitrospinota bacterium]
MNRHLFITVLTQVSVGGLFLNLAPVTSDLVRELGATYATMGMVITLFILGQAVASVPSGYLSDRFGVKRIYLGANAGVVLLVALLAAARSMEQILFLRFFLGMLMGTQFVVGSSYLAFWSPPGRMALFQGIYGGGFNFGITLSFLLAAPQVAWLGWRGCTSRRASSASPRPSSSGPWAGSRRRSPPARPCPCAGSGGSRWAPSACSASPWRPPGGRSSSWAPGGRSTCRSRGRASSG